MKLKIDPDIQALFEGLEGWTYKNLKLDIEENGVREPLVVAEDGTIICGHQRFAIASELGIEAPYKVRHFDNEQDMIDFAIKDNILRRQVNNYQKGLVGLRYLPFAKAEAKQRKLSTLKKGKENSDRLNLVERGKAYAIVGKKVGLSESTLRKVEYIETNGTEELKKKARAGELPVHGAFLEVRAGEYAAKPDKAARIPRLYDTRLLQPVKLEDDYIIATKIPADWYRGVRVTIEPLEKASLVAKAKREISEAQTEKALEQEKREQAEFDRLVSESLEKANMAVRKRKAKEALNTTNTESEPEFAREDLVIISLEGIKATFREEGNAEALEEILHANFPKAPFKGDDTMKPYSDDYEFNLLWTSKSLKRREAWVSEARDFFKDRDKYPNVKLQVRHPRIKKEDREWEEFIVL